MRLLVALALTLLSGFGAAWFAREFVRGVRSRRWPEAPATIVESHIASTRDSEGETYGVRIRYRYRVGDGEYEGCRIRFGGPFDSSFRSWAEMLWIRYPAGGPVRVRVSPDDAQMSVLEPGVRWSLFLMLGLFAGLWLYGLWLLNEELQWFTHGT